LFGIDFLNDWPLVFSSSMMTNNFITLVIHFYVTFDDLVLVEFHGHGQTLGVRALTRAYISTSAAVSMAVKAQCWKFDQHIMWASHGCST
jgi:hypothetical protein